MAFPTPASRGSGTQTSNTRDHTITFPGTVAANDGVIYFLVNDGGDATTVNDGFTKLLDQNHNAGSGAVRLTIAYHKMSGGETTTLVETSGNETSSHRVLRFAAADIADWDTSPPEVSVAATGGDAAPDAASLTVSWTTGEDNHWSVVYGIDGDKTATAYPSDTTDQFTVSSGSDAIGFAERYETALDTWDPTAFTSNDSDSWVAATVAIRPAAGGGGNTQLSGTASAELTTAGAATRTVALSGSATAELTTSGAATRTVGLSGAATAELTTEGSATIEAPATVLSGSATAELTTSGAATRTVALSGAATAELTTSGAATASAATGLSGSASAELTTSGVAMRTLSLSGSATAELTTAGAAARTVGLSGTATAELTTTGVADTAIPATLLSGTASAELTTAGAATRALNLSGTATAELTTAGAAVRLVGLSGTAVAELTTSGFATSSGFEVTTVPHGAIATRRHSAVATKRHDAIVVDS